MKQVVTKVKKKTASGFTTALPIGAKAQDITLQDGTILQDVIDVLSTGQAGHISLTQAQYNALSEEEKNNGTVYFVEDSASSGTITNASVIGYNDTNVQSALDNISINKINYSDVVNNLTSNSTSLPLSAAQGKELKDQIDSQDTRINILEDKTNAISQNSNHTIFSNTHVDVPDGYVNIKTNTTEGESRLTLNTRGRCGRLAATSESKRLGLWDSTMEMTEVSATTDNWVIVSEPDGTVRIPHALIAHAYNSSPGSERPVITTEMPTSNHTVSIIISYENSIALQALWGTSSTYSNRSISVPPGSDRRLKTNIKPAEKSALDLINALDIVQFDWKDGSGHWDFGIIAQDAGKLDANIPDGKESEDTYLTLNTMYLVDILLKATQQLSKKVDNLEQQIKELKKDNK